jgi:hypothetical protein
MIGISDIPVLNISTNGNLLTVNLTTGDDSLGYTPSSGTAGSFYLASVGQTVNFSSAGTLTVNPLSGNDTVTTYGTAASDAVAVTVDTTITVQVGTARAVNLPAGQIERVGIATLQGNDTINVSVYDTASAFLFVDGGEPSTVNKGNDALNFFDMSVGRKGGYSNISGGPSEGSGAIVLTFKSTGNLTRADYVNIEKQTRK